MKMHNSWALGVLKKVLSRQGPERVNYPDLLVQPPQNDPFFCHGQQARDAEWFVSVLQQAGLHGKTVHLRRIHYAVASRGDVLKLDGLPYQNTEADWMMLCRASLSARYLELIPPHWIKDSKNPEPQGFEITPGSWYSEGADEGEIDVKIDAEALVPSVRMPSAKLTFRPEQKYVCEIWIEKSTMEDVILPFCRKWGVTYVHFQGQASESHCRMLVERVKKHRKPTHIFYVSDFDPAGASMPRAVARKIEWHLDRVCLGHGRGPTVTVTPIALTYEQVAEYDLPEIPLKDGDRGATKHMERYGRGATELDALEALRPGALAEILYGAVRPWIDPEYMTRCGEAVRAAQNEIDKRVACVLRDHQGSVNRIERARKIYLRMLEDLNRKLEKIIEADLEANPIEVPIPEPDISEQPVYRVLMDSSLSYLNQIIKYKLYEGKDTPLKHFTSEALQDLDNYVLNDMPDRHKR